MRVFEREWRELAVGIDGGNWPGRLEGKIGGEDWRRRLAEKVGREGWQ